MSVLQFPGEIIEAILSHCDGRTLLSAKQVNSEWNNIVNYLDKSMQIWRYCCAEELPKYEYIEYKHQSNPNWSCIYQTRVLWENIKENIEFSVDRFEMRTNCNNISSITVAKDRIGVAFKTGKVLIFGNDGYLLNEYNYEDYEIISLHFVEDKAGIPKDMFVICKSMLITQRLSTNFINLNDIIDTHQTFDVYRDFYCGISMYEDHMIIRQLRDYDDKFGRHRIIANVPVDDISHFGIQVQRLRMLSEDVCAVLIYKLMYLIQKKANPRNNGTNAEFIVRRLDFESLCNKGMLNFNTGKIWILNDNVVLLTTSTLSANYQPQMFDIHRHKKITKVFIPQEVFSSMITSIYSHGNTLVFGTNDSCLYFYAINDLTDWDCFELEHYSHKIELGRTFGPVISIRMLQCKRQRRFYVASAWGKIVIVSGHVKQCIR